MSWTDERIELLKKLWAGGLSAGQIAGRFENVSRNSVIGKVHRLGLKRDTSVNVRNRAWASSDAAKAFNPRPRKRHLKPPQPAEDFLETAFAEAELEPEPVAVVIDESDPSESERISLIDLPSYGCKWPYGKGPYTFCGRDRRAGVPEGKAPHKSYCPLHAARSSGGTPPRSRKNFSLPTDANGGKRFQPAVDAAE